MRDTPTGQVTLVFTDVQGSTVLWDQASDGMRAALALHGLQRQIWSLVISGRLSRKELSQPRR
jgi:class 3 adenylate cyclase